jgi:hypothetical protein
VEIDWLKTIEDLFGDQLACPRCGRSSSQLLAGYSREPWAADVAPRRHDCIDKENCESRKLVFLCDACAKALRLRARPVDRTGMMTMLIEDCRADMDDCLSFLAEGWLEELDVNPEEMNSRLETIAPHIFEDESADRAEFEAEFLGTTAGSARIRCVFRMQNGVPVTLRTSLVSAARRPWGTDQHA